MKIAHLSDLHIGAIVSPLLYHALVSDLRKVSPQLLAVSGDITDRGRVQQYRQAKRFLDDIGVPYVTTPGNREIAASAFWEWIFPSCAMHRYEQYFGPADRAVRVFEHEDTAIIAVNSVSSLPSWPGALSRSTRYWLRETAPRLLQSTKILLLHHPVLPVIRSSSYWAHALSDAGAILEICSETGIELILQGHKHRSMVCQVNLPQKSARVAVSAAGAPLAFGWDPAYNVIALNHSSLEIQVRSFQDGAFLEIEKYAFFRYHARGSP